MKKNREFDRLAHFLLKKSSENFAKQMKVKQEIDANTALSKKDVRKLYSDIINAGTETQTIIARIMSAAEKSNTFRFSIDDANNLAVEEVAQRLGLKLDECDDCKKDSEIKSKLEEVGNKIAKEMGLKGSSVHAIKMSPEAAEKLSTILDAISKKNGDK